MKSRVIFLVVGPLILLLVACGGSSASTSTPITAPTPTPVPTSTPVPAPTPTPVPTSTPVPVWLIAVESYGNLAEEIVEETLADVDYGYDAMNDPNGCTYSQIDDARDRLSLAFRNQESSENELRLSRRAIEAPIAVEEAAVTLNHATVEAVSAIVDSLRIDLEWTELGFSMIGEEGYKGKSCREGKVRRSPELIQQLESFDESHIEFRKNRSGGPDSCELGAEKLFSQPSIPLVYELISKIGGDLATFCASNTYHLLPAEIAE